MSQSAAAHGTTGRVVAARIYAAHLMQASPRLNDLSGLNARLVQNFLAEKLRRAARDTEVALAEYGHVRDMSNPESQRVHDGVRQNHLSGQPAKPSAEIKPLVESVVSRQEGWIADWRTDVRPSVEAHTANELRSVGEAAVARAEIWAANSQSPELTRDEQTAFKEAGDLAQLQQVREQTAAGQVGYGVAQRPDGPAVAAASRGGWVPQNRGFQPSPPGGN